MGGDSLAKYETALKTGGGRGRGVRVRVGEGGTVLFSPFLLSPPTALFPISLKSD